jgi:hypothetical protein
VRARPRHRGLHHLGKRRAVRIMSRSAGVARPDRSCPGGTRRWALKALRSGPGARATTGLPSVTGRTSCTCPQDVPGASDANQVPDPSPASLRTKRQRCDLRKRRAFPTLSGVTEREGLQARALKTLRSGPGVRPTTGHASVTRADLDRTCCTCPQDAPGAPDAPRCRPSPLRGSERNGNAVICTFAGPMSRLAWVPLRGVRAQPLHGALHHLGERRAIRRPGLAGRLAPTSWASVVPFDSQPSSALPN